MRRFWDDWSNFQCGCALSAILVAAFIAVLGIVAGLTRSKPAPRQPPVAAAEEFPIILNDTLNRSVVLWDRIPKTVAANGMRSVDSPNMHPDNYVGPESCKKCHEKNYTDWSQHAHRWMNALATPSTVKGDFSPEASIKYLGGNVSFSSEDNVLRMHLTRDEVERVFRVTQTIGSRFFQYYVGVLESGPRVPGLDLHKEECVLPFGYWLSEKEWVPVVHVAGELPDFERADPFAPWHSKHEFVVYSKTCVNCHSTFPMGDRIIRSPDRVGAHAVHQLHWDTTAYLKQHRPESLNKLETWRESRAETGSQVPVDMRVGLMKRENTVTMGISCEACHLGCKEHVQDKNQLPRFFPHSEHLVIEGSHQNINDGRTHDNINWACGRCHTGVRPYYASGVGTWNSTEFSDAAKGSCYSKLTCVHCHNPHQTIGPKWALTPAQDDAKCIKCHEQFKSSKAIAAHTHHSIDSTGSACMNCHMPRINEGMQDLVRTHAIMSPTRKDMIEANQPNACNLCHTDKRIDWTLKYLADWYGAEFDKRKIRSAYPFQQLPVAVGWMKSENEAVRLVAADALARIQGTGAAPHLLDALNDPYLINRQFARRQLERVFDIRLADFGYQFYMTPTERGGPIRILRKKLLTP